MSNTYNTEEAAKAQEAYADAHNVPMFAPINGICYKCRCNIYAAISVEEAGFHLIKSCPYCGRSFTD